MPRSMTLCRHPRASFMRPTVPLPPPPSYSIGHSSRNTYKMAVPHSVPFPSGGTWFDTLHKTFDDVPVQANKDNAIPTSDFLEAAESLTTLFGQHPSPRTLSIRWKVPDLQFGRCSRLNGLHTRQERHGWQYQGLNLLHPTTSLFRATSTD